MHNIAMGQAYMLQSKCCGGNKQQVTAIRHGSIHVSSCHSSTIDACSKCKEVIAMLAMSAHKSNCSLAVFQLAPLKSVSTQTQHPMPTIPAHKGNLHHIAMLQPTKSCPPSMICTAKLGTQVDNSCTTVYVL